MLFRNIAVLLIVACNSLNKPVVGARDLERLLGGHTSKSASPSRVAVSPVGTVGTAVVEEQKQMSVSGLPMANDWLVWYHGIMVSWCHAMVPSDGTKRHWLVWCYGIMVPW